MKYAHSIFIPGLALICMASLSSPVWGQWIPGPNGSLYSNGNVGIGMSPSYTLDVNGTIHLTSGLYANAMWMQGGSAISVSSDTQNLYLSGNSNIFASVGGAIRFNINPTGNIGIGTTNPIYIGSPSRGRSAPATLSSPMSPGRTMSFSPATGSVL